MIRVAMMVQKATMTDVLVQHRRESQEKVGGVVVACVERDVEPIRF